MCCGTPGESLAATQRPRVVHLRFSILFPGRPPSHSCIVRGPTVCNSRVSLPEYAVADLLCD